MQVLHPPVKPFVSTGAGDNNNSVVLKLTYGDATFLLPADVERVAEQYLLGSGADLRADVLVAPHHGSRTSSSPEFLKAVAPSVVAVSAGLDNRFHHPHRETMEAFARLQGFPKVFITARDGSIVFESDGSRLWVNARK